MIRPSSCKLLHSPIALTEQLRSEIDTIGPVAHIVCPNLFHHIYASEAAATYPQALLHRRAALHRKRRELHFGPTLTDQPHPEWRDDLALLTIEGSMLGETVFYHPATRTLITCDLVENFRESPHWLTCNYLRMGGVLGHVGWHTLLRLVYRDSKRARACVDRLPLAVRASHTGAWRAADGQRSRAGRGGLGVALNRTSRRLNSVADKTRCLA